MSEIKISVSDEMDDLIQKVADELGIKKTEYVKSLVIENLKMIKYKEDNRK
jgi:isopentenyldiphosphate isomerase